MEPVSDHDPAMGQGDPFRSDWLTIVAPIACVASDPWRQTLEPLVAACHRTALRKFFPYTSVNQLYLAETAWPFAGIQDVYVVFSDTGDYEVRRGDGERWDVVVITRDPAIAATAMVEALGL